MVNVSEKHRQDLTIRDNKIAKLIKCVQHFEATKEFSFSDSNVDKSEIHESVRHGLFEIYKDQPELFWSLCYLQLLFLRYNKRGYQPTTVWKLRKQSKTRQGTYQKRLFCTQKKIKEIWEKLAWSFERGTRYSEQASKFSPGWNIFYAEWEPPYNMSFFNSFNWVEIFNHGRKSSYNQVLKTA